MKAPQICCLCVCLVASCSDSALAPGPTAAGEGGKADKRKPAAPSKLPPSRVESKMPESRPSPFSVTYQVDSQDLKTTIRVADDGTTFASAHGKLRVSARFITPPAALDELYKTLRTQKCDQTETAMERGGEKGGTLLQIQAGELRKVINDRGNFYPTKDWQGAYEICTKAVEERVPKPGDTPFAALELEFDASLQDSNISVVVDLGPDYAGTQWADNHQRATIRVGTVRPALVTVRGVSQPEERTVDLAKDHGLRISKRAVPEGDGKEQELVVEVLGGPAKTVGDVKAGTDEVTEQTKKETRLRHEKEKKAPTKNDEGKEAKADADKKSAADAKPG